MTHRPILPTIRELTPDDCIALLRQNNLGRLAFMSGDVPAILPVNFVFADGLIVFRTDPGEKLTEIPMRRVAFEIDGTSADGAWSVVAQGHAREVTTALGDGYQALRAIPIPIQASGDKMHWIAIEITKLTGRQII